MAPIKTRERSDLIYSRHAIHNPYPTFVCLSYVMQTQRNSMQHRRYKERRQQLIYRSMKPRNDYIACKTKPTRVVNNVEILDDESVS